MDKHNLLQKVNTRINIVLLPSETHLEPWEMEQMMIFFFLFNTNINYFLYQFR